MKFAIVDGVKSKATKGGRGKCPVCGALMIAKCGPDFPHHWAHKRKADCDPWWETETKWHRVWKNCFPEPWQEVVCKDSVTGEKHIADVKTPFGLVLEFQHSPIKPEERLSREMFYKKMIWIVNGLRAKTDKYYFENGLREIEGEKNVFEIHWDGPSKLLHRWARSKARVFFDFGDLFLWRLLEFDEITKIGKVKSTTKRELEKYINSRVKKTLEMTD